MGRKKGKQCGSHNSKRQNAEYHHKLYVDHASEANMYRNPVSRNMLGKGLGYRNATAPIENIGRWDSSGRSCHGDKWSSIFANRSSSSQMTTRPINGIGITHENQNAARGLAHLRHLLEERRTEDRFHDRQFRLALQRSRLRESHFSLGGPVRNSNVDDSLIRESQSSNPKSERLEPGWLLLETQHGKRNCTSESPVHFSSDNHRNNNSTTAADQQALKDRIPSLQSLAARVLGPLLPMYVAAFGHDFVGECLKSASPDILAELSISLAKSSSASLHEAEEAMYATTDGVVKALVQSGIATGLVLKGAPLLQDELLNEDGSIKQKDDDDTRWLSDQGLLALCPRLLPQNDVSDYAYNDDWETLDVDLDLTARMAGCFHLKRLELIDIPVQCLASAEGGITLGALRKVLQACPGITHLGLSGCFCNWTDTSTVYAAREASEEVGFLLCGTKLTILSTHPSTRSSQDQQVSNHLGQYDNSHAGDQMYGIKGLHSLLPKLQVLDVSYCTWVTPMMIFRFLLQCRENAKPQNTNNQFSSDDWNSTQQYQPPRVSLRLLGAMGCNLTAEDLSMIKEWISHSLFGSVTLLT